ncbi:hypothetical protein SAMD00019534_065520 [Acytostelium subglobosum LB1]|uniref:hypothetical protein n=1 Tax=Acytostelium subglobosum LB1 TaxID=1410327 RepID=UPI0006447B18|nr:hypothetical protein SAMD00019534_065520 [Acytostelium subglobosum LB1]GAM23377.1 hypothetical protein SAMD00019534_065520 [Acytostelium subglobosum LB1]|eukprot:XP_012753826.1 hypothetical protein SAMD00019534_065520 [Acytostelium subglobosum LB1]
MDDYDIDRNRSPSDVDRKEDSYGRGGGHSDGGGSSRGGVISAEERNNGNALHITGFSLSLKDEELREKFVSFGKILECVIMVDPNTKISRGFAFLTFEMADEADEAIRIMDGTKIDGNVIKVSKSRRSRPRESTPGSYMGYDKKRRGGGIGGPGGGGGGGPGGPPRSVFSPYPPYPYPAAAAAATKYPPYPPPYGGYYGYGAFPYQYPPAPGYGAPPPPPPAPKSSPYESRYSPYMRYDTNGSSRTHSSREPYDTRDAPRGADRDHGRGGDRDRDYHTSRSSRN